MIKSFPEVDEEVDQATIDRYWKWAARLEKVLKDIPDGLGIYTIGDPSLTIFLDPGYEIDLHDGRAEHLAVAHVDSKVPIHGVSG